ncbi:MAG: 3-oxoacyl-ACP reductase FabG [Acidobacteriota bacterium]|nr:3-oxoacyl-ACP reductase FabG [Acidobacteriota bacterium]
MQGLNNKMVMITGGTAGIGRAAARRFYAEGARLCLIDIAEDPALADEFPERTDFIKADVSSADDVERIGHYVAENGLDVLVNNAGITRDASIGKMTIEQWDAVIRVNLTGVFLLSQMAAAHMKAQGSGVILNAASVVAHYGNFGQTNYSATKAGVIAMTKTLSKELGKYNVRVNAIAPGFIETEMVAKMPEKVLAMMRDKAPLKRLGKPEEVAAVYAFLASDDGAFITGATINVDGGIVLG